MFSLQNSNKSLHIHSYIKLNMYIRYHDLYPAILLHLKTHTKIIPSVKNNSNEYSPRNTQLKFFVPWTPLTQVIFSTCRLLGFSLKLGDECFYVSTQLHASVICNILLILYGKNSISFERVEIIIRYFIICK